MNKKNITKLLLSLFFLSLAFTVGLKFETIYFKIFLPITKPFRDHSRNKNSIPLPPVAYQAVDCPTESIQIVYFGQSNTANWVKPKATLKVPTNLLQYDWRTGQCYNYLEPLLGTDNKFGNVITYTAVKVAEGSEKPVIVIPFSRSPSSILDWAYGYMSYQHQLILDSMKENGLSPQIFIWHQGETDSKTNRSIERKFVLLPYFKNPDFGDFPGLTKEAYGDALTKIYRRTMAVFPDASFGIALVGTFCDEAPWEPVRDAQMTVARGYENTFIAADSDAIKGVENRHDGCHFTDVGAAKIGGEYYDAIAPILGLQ